MKKHPQNLPKLEKKRASKLSQAEHKADATEAISPLQESAFFAAQVHGSGPLPISSAQIQLQLKNKIEACLHEVFKTPPFIEMLTNYLSEVVHEDPKQGALFGVVEENSVSGSS